MNIVKRGADERGKADHGWLKTAHSLSFSNYNYENFIVF